jgi:hypothetical protein
MNENDENDTNKRCEIYISNKLNFPNIHPKELNGPQK